MRAKAINLEIVEYFQKCNVDAIVNIDFIIKFMSQKVCPLGMEANSMHKHAGAINKDVVNVMYHLKSHN